MKSFGRVGGGAGQTALDGSGRATGAAATRGQEQRTLLACKMEVVGLVFEELRKISEKMDRNPVFGGGAGWAGQAGKPGEERGLGHEAGGQYCLGEAALTGLPQVWMVWNQPSDRRGRVKQVENLKEMDGWVAVIPAEVGPGDGALGSNLGTGSQGQHQGGEAEPRAERQNQGRGSPGLGRLGREDGGRGQKSERGAKAKGQVQAGPE